MPGVASRLAGADLAGDLDQREDVVVGRPEVDEARAQADLAVHVRRRDPDPPVLLERLDEPRVVRVEILDPGGDVAERDDREIGWPADRLEVVVARDLAYRSLAWLEVPLDRVADRLDAVRAKRHPELQGAERARVLERDVDHVRAEPVVRDVGLLVRERGFEISLGAGRARCRTPSGGTSTCARRRSASRRASSPANRARTDGTVAAAPP